MPTPHRSGMLVASFLESTRENVEALFGTVIDEKYSQLLAVYPELDLQSVVLLDMVQKEQPITKSQAKSLRSLGLVEGRYPRLTISSSVAKALDKQREYVRSKGLDNHICKELILQLLRSRPSTRIEILTVIRHALPKGMTEQQQANRVSYLLQSLRKQGKIYSDGATSSAKWHPQKDS
ncbi:MAG: hypothetical protein LKI78_02375 [Bifidobacterium tibiigranuli]|jgi:ATP-dependent DNA helicase RecG|nr:hypothetical protein [Bifidobacterium tibiigranuli]